MAQITSKQLREAAAASQTSESVVMLLTITAKNLADSLNFTDCDKEHFGFVPDTGVEVRGLTVDGARYIAYPFTWILPDIDAGEKAEVKIVIDNIGQELVQTLRETAVAPAFDMRVVLASQPTVIERRFPQMRLLSASLTTLTIQGTLGLVSYLQRLLTAEKFMPGRYYSLFMGVQ